MFMTEPVAAETIAYREELDDTRTFIVLVRLIGVMAVVLGAAGCGQAVVVALSLLGIPGVAPAFANRGPVQLLHFLPPALLLVGGVACLWLRPMARRLMITYAVLSIASLLFELGFAVVMGIQSSSSLGGMQGSMSFILYHALGMLARLAFPCLVLALMFHRPVRRLFMGR